MSFFDKLVKNVGGGIINAAQDIRSAYGGNAQKYQQSAPKQFIDDRDLGLPNTASSIFRGGSPLGVEIPRVLPQQLAQASTPFSRLALQGQGNFPTPQTFAPDNGYEEGQNVQTNMGSSVLPPTPGILQLQTPTQRRQIRF